MAVAELARGTPNQVKHALGLIATHKLYKHGLKVFAETDTLREVKELII